MNVLYLHTFQFNSCYRSDLVSLSMPKWIVIERIKMAAQTVRIIMFKIIQPTNKYYSSNSNINNSLLMQDTTRFLTTVIMQIIGRLWRAINPFRVMEVPTLLMVTLRQRLDKEGKRVILGCNQCVNKSIFTKPRRHLMNSGIPFPICRSWSYIKKLPGVSILFGYDLNSSEK